MVCMDNSYGFSKSVSGNTSRAKLARLFMALGVNQPQHNKLDCIWGKTALSMRDVETMFEIFIDNTSCCDVDGTELAISRSLPHDFAIN